MAAFETGAFSSDGALKFLRELAEEAPDRRAAALERLFQSVKDQPDPVGRNVFPDQVVAAAAIVAATVLGGDQFDERLQVLAADDPAVDARLPTPADGLAGAALEALAGVAGRWRQERSKEAGQTIAALSQVLSRVSVLDDLDMIWNDACDYGAEAWPSPWRSTSPFASGAQSKPCTTSGWRRRPTSCKTPWSAA